MAAAAYATKFGGLLRPYGDAANNIGEGIYFSTEAAADLEESLAQLRPETSTPPPQDDQTTSLEDSITTYIDLAAALNSQKEILQSMKTRLMAGEDLGDIVRFFEKAVEEQTEAYKEKRKTEGYKDEDDYIKFKEKVWQKRCPNRPFRMDGEAEEEDDDLVITTQQESLICPLSVSFFGAFGELTLNTHFIELLQQGILDDPVTSKDCKHSYSRAAIVAFLGHAPYKECPVAGCRKYVRLSDLKKNRNLARLAAKRRAEEEDDDDEEEYTMVE
ncbi:hypothetical protein HK104_007764 [Borealophlyctis nickersoniae]|nr:hypothetical protein HK104_007764 [Borealophlyctis nickersoniae]